MLSRVAENLFWIGRYMERAENVARLVDVARRMSALPNVSRGQRSNEWSSVLIAAGARDVFGDAIERADSGTALDHLFFEETNPSSIRNCLINARENGRAVRFALTQECWEALNSSWSHVRKLDPASVHGPGLSDVIDWVKAQSAMFTGSMNATMVRDDGYDFIRLGAAIERIDSTARLLDVKYHVLLPSVGDVGSTTDHYQWLSLLQSAAAQRAYFFMTKDDMNAKAVASFLILQKRFPRTIRYNVRRVCELIEDMETFYNRQSDCHDEVMSFRDDLERQSIDDIFAYGLHEFLTDTIERNYMVADKIAAAYGFAPMISEQSQSSTVNGQ